MTNEKTDNTDEPTKAELHDRVRKLESTVEKLMPSRRDALRMGAAGLAGAAGLGAASQSAEASTGSAGDIGDPNNRPDLFADEIDANQLTGVSTGGIKTKTRVSLSSSSTATPVPFDTITFDPDGNFDTTANEYTAPANGTYILSLSIAVITPASGDRARFKIERNGNKLVRTELIGDGSGRPTTSLTDVREFSSGEIITATNPTGQTIEPSAATFFSIVRLE